MTGFFNNFRIAAAVFSILFLAVLLTLSCSCFGENISPGTGTQLTEKDISADSKEGAGKEEITVVLDWVPNTNHTGIYVAAELGYYSQNGFEVEIIQPSEGGSADLIAAGKGHFGISYQEQVTYARTATNPLPVIAVAAIIQHNTSGFASPAEKNIKSPLDFEGKKYGGWGSPMEEAVLKGLMNKYGGDFEKIELVNIGAADFFTSVTKDVDFTWIYYGWDGVAAEVKDFKINFMLLQDLDKRLDFYTPVIIVSENTAKDKPEMVRKFLAATEQGYRFAWENPEDAARVLLSSVPELDSEIVVASQQYLAGKYREPGKNWGQMEPELWKTFGDWMYENGLIELQLDVNNAFTNEFLP